MLANALPGTMNAVGRSGPQEKEWSDWISWDSFGLTELVLHLLAGSRNRKMNAQTPGGISPLPELSLPISSPLSNRPDDRSDVAIDQFRIQLDALIPPAFHLESAMFADFLQRARVESRNSRGQL